MTKKERDQVVELLRSSADCGYGPAMTAILIGAPVRVERLAYDAWNAVDATSWRDSLLETAQRVEEGSWP